MKWIAVFVSLMICMLMLASVDAQSEKPIEPFPTFPGTKIVSSPGEYVLTPSLNWQKDAMEKGADKVTFIFYHAKMNTPGDFRSDVAFTFDGVQNLPNYMIVPIPAAGKAKKGDVVLTWWQSGSGMKRGYVVNDTEPDAPVVRYIDIDYDNPAKNRDGVPIGQMDEKLKPNTFMKLTTDWQPGTTVAALSGTKYTKGTIIAVSGGQVLTVGFANRMSIFPQNQCKPVPIIPSIKVGDKVQVPHMNTFVNGVVIKVDTAIGRVFTEIEWGGKKKELAVPFGDVMTGLVI